MGQEVTTFVWCLLLVRGTGLGHGYRMDRYEQGLLVKEGLTRDKAGLRLFCGMDRLGGSLGFTNGVVG